MVRFEIKIYGIVQGVGFRPFIFSAAKSHSLTGFVLNDGNGVIAEFEGDEKNIEKLMEYIKTELPRGASIEKIEVVGKETCGFKDFAIKESTANESGRINISPDLGICPECIDEMKNPKSRFYNYPFISCSVCGPRFSIMEDLPYDRPNTSMKYFPMCETCENEYKDPSNRRFHAQTIACDKCGPKLSGISLEDAAEVLENGKILAIKGIGGYHIACSAKNEMSVNLLRERKHRPHKPFAIMMDIQDIKKHCHLSKREEGVILGKENPIVLLKQKEDSDISKAVNPNIDTLGVMIPYTGFHKLLIQKTGPLIMTSGNVSGEPIIADGDVAEDKLKYIVDGFIHHDREITNRCDDSVVRILKDKMIIIRRSRGFVPKSIEIGKSGPDMLACGGDLKNTFCIYKNGKAYASQYIGDLINKETYDWYAENIEKFKNLLNADIKYIICDYHPMYQSTRFAKECGLPIIQVQHHHAHIASVMGEHNFDGQVIGVAFDGTGYGDDGNLWGGEFFVASRSNYSREYHFENIIMPGGEKAIDEPWRMGASYLCDAFGSLPDIEFSNRINAKEWETLRNMIEKGYNFPVTSSVGRLFDAVSSIIGIRDVISYEGQAAIELEAIADDKIEGIYPFKIENGVISAKPMIIEIVNDIKKGISKNIISMKFHNTIAEIVLNSCQRINNNIGLKRVILSGGVFQNILLLEICMNKLQRMGFEVYFNSSVPPNDGCISLGQIIAGIEKI